MASQKKNLMTIAMQSFSICCLITLAWMIFGYSLAFTSFSPVIGGASRFFLMNFNVGIGHPLAPSVPEPLFCAFQLGNHLIQVLLSPSRTVKSSHLQILLRKIAVKLHGRFLEKFSHQKFTWTIGLSVLNIFIFNST